MKPYIASFSDLAGPLNPAGIINAKFLSLMSALNRGDHPDNVKQALFDWLGEKNFSPAQVARLLELDPDAAVTAIIRKLGGGFRQDMEGKYRLPQLVIDTLRRTLARIGKDVRHKRGHEIGQEIARMRQIKKRFTPEALVTHLLA